MPLSYCPNCKENSVTRKVYKAQDYLWSHIKHRVEFCIKKGCGYKNNLGDIFVGTTLECFHRSLREVEIRRNDA